MAEIKVILGTARKGRFSENVAKYVAARIRGAGHSTEVLDVRDYRSEATDNTQKSDAARRYKEKISSADALVIVSPEYNHGYPGELKMMLDMLYKDYYGKPCGIAGVSMGNIGGARVVEQLRQVVAALGMPQTQQALYFFSVQADLFDPSGKITDDAYDGRVDKFLDELVALTGK